MNVGITAKAFDARLHDAEDRQVDRIWKNIQDRDLVGLLCDVARKYHFAPRSLLGRSRHATVTCARHEFWSLVHGTLAPSLPELGRMVERDHTTVMSALRKRERALAAEYGCAS